MSRYFTKTLASLEPYTPGEQLKIADIVKLNANENPYPPAPGVAAAVAAAVPGLRLYSDLTNGDLNAAIARHWGVRPENILCGNGSDENLLLALRAFCDESTPLAFADVTYSFYTVLCDLLHIPQHIIPLEADLTIDLKKYCGLHETIVIANPNAPTSLLAPVDAIEEVLQTNPDNIVIVDETYVEFAPAGSSCLPLLEKYDNLVITHTFSKTHNLAGARLGFCIARPALIADMNRVKFSYSPYNVNAMTQAAGAAAISIVKLLLSAGFQNVTMCDRKGAIYKGRDGLNWIKEEMAEVTNLDRKSGSLADMLVGADVFIGVSAPGTVTTEMVRTMNRDAIIFACANPTPEIFPEEAYAAGAKIVSTGRSDYPNQINNVLAFPGIFRGAFDVRASDINEEMKMAAAQALADLVSPEELSADYIIPAAFDKRVGPAVAKAVAEAARKSGVARI